MEEVESSSPEETEAVAARLAADYARIPALLGRNVEPPPEPEPLLVRSTAEPAVQLGLF